MRFPLTHTDAQPLRDLARQVIKHRVPSARLVGFVELMTGLSLVELSAPCRELVRYIGGSFINCTPIHVAALLRAFAQHAEGIEAVELVR
jgi:hypothetical protein